MVVSSTEIEVSWEEVPAIDQNGIITVYEVQYVTLETCNGSIYTLNTNTTMLNTTLTDLEEYVEYNITVRAYTSVGPGPYSDPPITERTDEDGRSFQFSILYANIYVHTFTVPDMALQNVMATALTSDIISVSWQEMSAICQNGNVTMYEIQYEPLEIEQ